MCLEKIETGKCNDSGSNRACNEGSDCMSNMCPLYYGQRRCANSEGKAEEDCNCDFGKTDTRGMVSFDSFPEQAHNFFSLPSDYNCITGRCENKRCKTKDPDGSGCNEDSDCESGKCWNPLSGYGTCGYSGNPEKRLEDNKRCNQSSDCKSGR